MNINQGHNVEMMENCKKLQEYAYYVNTVREYNKTMVIEDAVASAIDHCIKSDILAEFLRVHRGEVETMSIFEYDSEKHMDTIRREGREDGIEEGCTIKIIEIIQKQLNKGVDVTVVADLLDMELSEVARIRVLLEKMEGASSREIAKIYHN